MDLFAGTGGISFEFASRGCKDIELVENDKVHMMFIRKVIREWHMQGVIAHETSAFSYIKHPKKPFDIIFCDPPYDMEGIDKIPSEILKRGLLSPEGWLVFEHSGKYDFDKIPGFHEERNYGSVHFTIFTAIQGLPESGGN